MKELTDLLAGAGAKKTSDFLSHFQLDTTMVEELLPDDEAKLGTKFYLSAEA